MKNKLLSLSLLFLLIVAVIPCYAQNSKYDPNKRYVILLADGTRLTGKILQESKEEIVFEDKSIGVRTIPRNKIRAVEPEHGTEIWKITLKDNTVLTGQIFEKNDSITILQTESLGEITLRNNNIALKEIITSGFTQGATTWYENPNSTRYLFAPSAIALKAGEGYYQNFYGVGNAVNYGLTDYFSIGGGIVGLGAAFITPKLGFKVTDFLHVGAGVFLGNSFLPFEADNVGVGLGYGLVTLGNTDHNFTVGAGYGFNHQLGITDWQEYPIIVANGMGRLNKKFALVTENWIVPFKSDVFDRGLDHDHYEVIFSYAMRFMGENSTIDFGFLNTPALIESGWYIGIPYIDFVVRFGKYKNN